jgi:hypothetical protein
MQRTYCGVDENHSKNKISESITYTQNVIAGKEIKQKYPPFILQEIFYDDQNYREIYQEVEHKVITALENFMTSPQFEQFKLSGKMPGSYVRKKIFIPLTEQINISGEADLAFYKDDAFEINDWKTGKVEDGDDSMQLLTYTLWAIEQVGVDLSKIKIFKSYLQRKQNKRTFIKRT